MTCSRRLGASLRSRWPCSVHARSRACRFSAYDRRHFEGVGGRSADSGVHLAVAAVALSGSRRFCSGPARPRACGELPAYGRRNVHDGRLAEHAHFTAGYQALEVPYDSKVYLVDFDQCLSQSPKYDNYFSKLLEDHGGDMSIVASEYTRFCLTEDAELAMNRDVLDKVLRFRGQFERSFVAIWTARSLETQSLVDHFLRENGVASHFDAGVFCAGAKATFIQSLLAKAIPGEDIFVIDDSLRNCKEAMAHLPEENVEHFVTAPARV